MEHHISIRDARPDDMAAITAIYAHAVKTGTASFELNAPDESEMRRRYEALAAGDFPYLVAERDQQVLGYAYVGAYRPRPAYRFSVEDSVYVAPDAQGQGVGRLLLSTLIEAATQRGFRQMIAVIGDEASAGSIALHRSCGFEHAGILRDVGFKFGEWRATVLMQRALGPGNGAPPADGS